MPRVLGLVLAGGESRRMGFDKAKAAWGEGGSLLDWAAERLAPQVAALRVNRHVLDPELAYPQVPDAPSEGRAGPLAGILAGLEAAHAGGFEALATVPVDAPFFPQNLVARLEAERAGARVAFAATPEGRQPVFGLWSAAGLEDLGSRFHAGERKIDRAAAQLGFVEVFWEEASLFANLNRPEDLAAARTRKAFP